jgi:hypothetical protein
MSPGKVTTLVELVAALIISSVLFHKRDLLSVGLTHMALIGIMTV